MQDLSIARDSVLPRVQSRQEAGVGGLGRRGSSVESRKARTALRSPEQQGHGAPDSVRTREGVVAQRVERDQYDTDGLIAERGTARDEEDPEVPEEPKERRARPGHCGNDCRESGC